MKYFNDVFTSDILRRLAGSTARQANQYTGDLLAGRLFNIYAPYSSVQVPVRNAPINRPPSFCVEKWIGPENIVKQTVVDVKTNRSNLDTEGMLDNIHDYINTAQLGVFEGNGSVFAVVIRMTTIGFYIYRANPELLDFNIPSYKNFVPLSYIMSQTQWAGTTTKRPNDYRGYAEYLDKRRDITTDPWVLEDKLGVKKTSHLDYPHLYDLKDHNHQDNIHALFKFIKDNEIE